MENERETDTLLFEAAKEGNLRDVELLVEKGLDVNVRAENGASALNLALANDHLDVAKFLIEHGADVNKSGAKGVTPLMLAAAKGHLEIVKLLLKCGADVNAKSEDGFTALVFAACFDKVEVAKLLMEHGAKADVKDKNGNTALDVAKTQGNSKMVKVLKKSPVRRSCCGCAIFSGLLLVGAFLLFGAVDDRLIQIGDRNLLEGVLIIAMLLIAPIFIFLAIVSLLPSSVLEELFGPEPASPKKKKKKKKLSIRAWISFIALLAIAAIDIYRRLVRDDVNVLKTEVCLIIFGVLLICILYGIGANVVQKKSSSVSDFSPTPRSGGSSKKKSTSSRKVGRERRWYFCRYCGMRTEFPGEYAPDKCMASPTKHHSWRRDAGGKLYDPRKKRWYFCQYCGMRTEFPGESSYNKCPYSPTKHHSWRRDS